MKFKEPRTITVKVDSDTYHRLQIAVIIDKVKGSVSNTVSGYVNDLILNNLELRKDDIEIFERISNYKE